MEEIPTVSKLNQIYRRPCNKAGGVKSQTHRDILQNKRTLSKNRGDSHDTFGGSRTQLDSARLYVVNVSINTSFLKIGITPTILNERLRPLVSERMTSEEDGQQTSSLRRRQICPDKMKRKKTELLLLDTPSFPLGTLSSHLHPHISREAAWNELVLSMWRPWRLFRQPDAERPALLHRLCSH